MHRWLLLLGFLARTLLAQPDIALTSPRIGPAPMDQLAPKIATNDRDFLVAWNDRRGGSNAVYAQRIRADGTILDGTGIRVSHGMQLLALVRAGGAYVLILASGTTVLAARIDDGGVLVDPPHVVLTNVVVRAAASNGSRILLAEENGVWVLDDRGSTITHTVLAPQAYGVGIGSNGSTFLVVTFTYPGSFNAVNLVALDADGCTLGTTQLIEAGGGDGPVIATDGSDYLVLYAHGGGDFVALVADRNATVKSEHPLDLRMNVPAGALQWTGSAYLLAAFAYDLNATAATTLARDGAVIGSLHVLGASTPGVVDVPSIAWNGDAALIAWSAGAESDANGWEIEGALTAADGSARGAAMTIPRSANAQRLPAIATGGANDLAVWSEMSGIVAARITPGGASLDPNGIAVASARWPQPRVVFDGDDYLVAWISKDGVHGQRVDGASGALVGNDTTLLARCTTDFDLGRDDAGVLLVAADCGGNLVAQRIGGGGAVTISNLSAGFPRIAWNGSEWLIVFDELILIPTLGPVPVYRGNVYAERLSDALAVLDAQPIAVAVDDPDPVDEWMPLVASDGRDFLVTWTREYPERGVRARAVHADGTLGETTHLVDGNVDARSIVFDGTRYAVAYDVDRGDFTYELYLTHGGSDRIPISTAAPDQREVALAMSGPMLRAVYARVAPEPQYGGVFRVFLRDFAARRRVAAH